MRNVIIVLALLFCACGGVELEQEVRFESVIDCTYTIQTSIWVKEWDGGIISLEYNEYARCHYAQLDSMRQVERAKAEKLLPKIIKCYEHGCP